MHFDCVLGPNVNHTGLAGRFYRCAPTRSPTHARVRDFIPSQSLRGCTSLRSGRPSETFGRARLPRGQGKYYIIHRHGQAGDGWRLRREGLRGPSLFSGHVAFRHGSLFDGPQRLTGHPVEHEKQSRLRRHRHNIDHLAVVPHREQLRFGTQSPAFQRSW